MKKQLLFYAFILLSTAINAYSAEINGIYYNFSGTKATVTYKNTYYNSYSGTVVIPRSVTYNGTTYSVTSIGEDAFKNCKSLTSVTIPNSVTSIGSEAFYGCSSLTSVTIPNSVTSIGKDAFKNCYFAASAFVNNSTLTSDNYWGATICDEETDDGLLIKGNVVLKFRSGATIVIIPESVTSIGNSAFNGCTSLTSITIPNSVKSINGSAFQGCI